MSQNNFTLIPHVVINPTSITIYNEILYDLPHKRNNNSKFIDTSNPDIQDPFLNSKRKNDGTLSVNAKRKLQKAIEYLITVAKERITTEKISGKKVTFRTAFITLTLPASQQHTDNTIIDKCLNQFLIEIKKDYWVQNYVWRAERQQNGNIHFHILVDKFIPWQALKNKWNRIINKLGYVDRFQEKYKHQNPNSTDIHSTKKVHNIKSYLCKYMTKTGDKLPTQEVKAIIEKYQSGRIWSCNQELSNARGLNLIIDSEIDTELKKIEGRPEVKKYEGDYFTVYSFDYHLFLKVGSTILFRYFSDYLHDTLNFSEQLQISL